MGTFRCEKLHLEFETPGKRKGNAFFEKKIQKKSHRAEKTQSLQTKIFSTRLASNRRPSVWDAILNTAERC